MTAKHVAPDYLHSDKAVRRRVDILLGSSRLKWYDLARPGEPVSDPVQRTAEAFLARAAQAPDWPLNDDVGFVMLHRCGAAFYFLIVCTWRGDNELWQTVYFKPNEATPDFALFPQNAHKGTFCVWEMGIVWAETQAWRRYLMSDRSPSFLEEYMAFAAQGDV
jgi:hypothetical protein